MPASPILAAASFPSGLQVMFSALPAQASLRLPPFPCPHPTHTQTNSHHSQGPCRTLLARWTVSLWGYTWLPLLLFVKATNAALISSLIIFCFHHMTYQIYPDITLACF